MQESSFARLEGQIVPADESSQLTKPIRLRVPTPVLQVQLLRDAGASVDVVASRDSKPAGRPQRTPERPVWESTSDGYGRKALTPLRRPSAGSGLSPGLCWAPCGRNVAHLIAQREHTFDYSD